MSSRLIEELQQFKDKKLNDEIFNKITDIATRHHCRISLMSENVPAINIDNEGDRLNVHMSKDYIITKFTIG